MDIAEKMYNMACRAREAARLLGASSPEKKNFFLERVASLLASKENEIFAANAKDVEMARKSGMDDSRLDRLTLKPRTMADMRDACLHIASLPDPIGATESQWQRPNGLLVGKMRVPLGVVAMIYESRPNVTIDAAIIAIKSGNAIILRGGKEALNSNIELSKVLQEALKDAQLPEDAVQLVDTTAHEAVLELCKLDELIDVVIPRGGENLIRAVCAAATVPVLKHYKGVCHAYIDKSANLEQACVIVENAKLQRPGVCNALEGLLVHQDIAAMFLPLLAKKLTGKEIEFRACEKSLPLLGSGAKPIAETDKGCEFHAPILSVTIVKDMDEALDYIAIYGSRHTDIICTQDYANAMRFLREVDASMVALNDSTRFNDGGQLGLGAEIGISTSKLHAYGPMGVNELTTTKFVVLGNGQIRQ